MIFDHLHAALGDRETVAVETGAIGGDGGGWRRHVRLTRDGATISASIYGNEIARVYPDGTADVRHLGHVTPSTAVALSYVFTGHGGASSRRTPGSRGGKPGPWTLTIYTPTGPLSVGRDWTAYPEGIAR